MVCNVSGVIDLRVRPRVQGLLISIGRLLAGLGLTPTAVTLSGLLVAVVGALLVTNGRPVWGGVVFLAGSALDGLDGAVARASDRVSNRGAFLDAGVDRLGEIAVHGAVAVAFRHDSTIVLLAMWSMAAGLMIPYLRAKAEALGVDGRSGVVGRAERAILIALALITGWIVPVLWLLLVGSWLTVAQRFFSAYRSIPT